MSVCGKFKLTNSENFTEYMTAIGVGFVMRNMAAAATPVTEIKLDGDEYTITTTTTFKTTVIKFKLGVEFDEETADGRKCKSTITLEGDNKLVHTQKCDGKEYVILREFSEKEMIMTLAADKVVCKRTYTKV